MKMTSKKMRELLQEKLQSASLNIKYDREKDQLRFEDVETKKGIEVSLPGVISKWEERKEKAIDEVVYHVKEALIAMNKSSSLSGMEKKIFPVIRSTSFPTETSGEIPLIYEEHTAETRIFFAIDLGTTYKLIDKNVLDQEGWNNSKIKEIAMFNLRSLSTSLKVDEVAGNSFYFLNENDGYDASRLLNESFLLQVEKQIKGTMVVAVPHQDVLIIADIQNDYGYDIIGQMTMQFFAEGRVPITALSFIYENKELEPLFILAKNKPK